MDKELAYVDPPELVAFRCECYSPTCVTTIPMPVEIFIGIRSAGRAFVAVGHAGTGELIVERQDGYVVVSSNGRKRKDVSWISPTM